MAYFNRGAGSRTRSQRIWQHREPVFTVRRICRPIDGRSSLDSMSGSGIVVIRSRFVPAERDETVLRSTRAKNPIV